MDFIINMTITTTVTAVGILLIKTIFKNRMSPQLHVLIWAILAVRILVPMLPESQWSIFNFVPMVHSTGMEAYHSERSEAEITETISGEKGTERNMEEDVEEGLGINNQSQYKSTEKSFSIIQYLKQNIITLWLAGAVVLFCYFTCIYLLFSYRIQKMGIHQDDKAIKTLNKYKAIMEIKRNVSITRYGRAPMLKGIFKPIIIIPKDYDSEELKYAVIHELCHFKYNDILINLVSTLLLCLNWYNPIIWLCHSIFRRDIELLCDQRVLKITDEKKAYAELLLKTACNQKPLLPITTNMSNSKKEIKRRISFMANYKKPARIWIIIMVVVIGLFGAGCLLNETDDDLNLLVQKEKEGVDEPLEGNPETDNIINPLEDKDEVPQSTEDLLKQLEDQNFSIAEEKISKEDDETIVEFGKAFINLLNGAIGNQQKVYFDKYISNKTLQKFTDKMLELTQKQDLQGGNAVNYGFENEFKQAKLEHIGENICYLEIPFEFEGSGMGCKMLIIGEDKALKIVDFYFGSKDGVDTFSTGHPADREINNPNLWEDRGWVKGVFQKLKDLGSGEKLHQIISGHPSNNLAYCYVVTSDVFILKNDIPMLIEKLDPTSWIKTDNVPDEKTLQDIIINFNEFPQGKNENNFDYNMGTDVVNQLVIKKETSLVYDWCSEDMEMYLLGSDTIKSLQTFIDEKGITHEQLMNKMN